MTQSWNFTSFDPLLDVVQDNVFIMSNRKSKFPVLQLDLRFVYLSIRWKAYGLSYINIFILTYSICLSYYSQIDIRSRSCYCVCYLWWHCLCLCWTTGMFIITILLSVPHKFFFLKSALLTLFFRHLQFSYFNRWSGTLNILTLFLFYMFLKHIVGYYWLPSSRIYYWTWRS